jgi:hypothetical protein
LDVLFRLLGDGYFRRLRLGEEAHVVDTSTEELKLGTAYKGEHPAPGATTSGPL